MEITSLTGVRVQFVSMFSTKIVAFTTMVLLVTEVVSDECICCLRLKQIQNIKIVTCQSISIMPSRNNEEASRHLLIPKTNTVSSFDGHL